MDNSFTTTQAAEYLGIPSNTLCTWINRGWVSQIRTPESAFFPKRKWSRLTVRELISLRLVKEFNRFMTIKNAAECAASCEPAVVNYLLGGIEEERRDKYRFVGVQFITHEGKTIYAPHYDESLARFQSTGCFAYFVIDLAAIPMPATLKESPK